MATNNADNRSTIATVAQGGSGVATLATGKLVLGAGTSNLSTVRYVTKTSFTPKMTFSGASVGITYTSRSGVYQRVGNLVFVSISIVLSNKGSSSGIAAIQSLPFAVDNTYGYLCENQVQNITFAGYVDSLFNTVSILMASNVSGIATALLTDTSFTNTSSMIFTGWYVTADA